MPQVTIQPAVSPVDITAVRALFEAYGDFLRATQACGTHFHYERFQAETVHLPDGYFDLLLARVDGEAAACIALREGPDATTCEIKRLFVLPAFRGMGLARQLVETALARIAALGFSRVILDTDTANMQHAHALYLAFGFREYKPREASLAFLERAIQPAPEQVPAAASAAH